MFLTTTAKNSILLPSTALLADGDSAYVRILEASRMKLGSSDPVEARLRPVSVTCAGRTGATVAVSGWLNIGDLVVVNDRDQNHRREITTYPHPKGPVSGRPSSIFGH